MNDTAQKSRILIVDDAPENIWILIENLEKNMKYCMPPAERMLWKLPFQMIGRI